MGKLHSWLLRFGFPAVKIGKRNSLIHDFDKLLHANTLILISSKQGGGCRKNESKEGKGGGIKNPACAGLKLVD
jgi:hypothetical protein